jgi:hypothetical protein
MSSPRTTPLRAAAWTLVLCAACAARPAAAQTPWVVKPEWVLAHERFLASDALQGRGSATRDEAIAATYVAAAFTGYGLAPPPGQDGYLQTADIASPRLEGRWRLKLGWHAFGARDGALLISSSGIAAHGPLAIVTASEPTPLPEGAVVLLTAPDALTRSGWMRAAQASGAQLLIIRGGPDADRVYAMLGSHTAMRSHLATDRSARRRPNVVALPPALFARFAASAGKQVTLDLPDVIEDRKTTANAIGFLPGTDPDASVLLFSAHLDHLGVRADGAIMHGANDDASGVTAVLELAHALAAGPRLRRGILFVCYGSEEIGGFGSTYFAAHAPVPLERIAANLEFEMIGVPDPKLPRDTLMMTGFERSNLGAALLARGFHVTADPYPEKNFFERSDNYSLALAGVVAHTLAGGGEVPTYHQPGDTVESLDLGLLVSAIQSLVEPARWLADGDFVPAWNAGGKPVR